MPDRNADFLIVGGGVAGASCAAKLREEGAEGSILLVGREPDPPYERPPLSKGYLAGDEDRDAAMIQPYGWWDEQNVELATRTSVMKIDSEERVAKLSSKEEVGFDRLLLATGANVRRLRVDGSDLDGVHYLRAFGNSDAIREDAGQAEHVVMIGGSYIGCEVAATLTNKFGVTCSIVMQESATFDRHFGPEVGQFFHDLLASKGIHIHGDDELERFEGDEERVRRVVTKAGKEMDCDMVVMGTGVMPDVMLARSAGLDLGDSGGIKCSSTLESSVPGIFAAGDMCEYDSEIHGRSLRAEHFEVAAEQGKTAALNMMGTETPHREVPYFFSDLADWAAIEYVGPGEGEPVIRGSLEDGEFTAFYVDSGKVTAALTVGRSDDLEHAKRFIAEGTEPDTGALSDPDTDLGSL